MLILAAAAVAVVADLVHFLSMWRRRAPYRGARLAWALATDSLPLVLLIMGAVCHDNSSALMASMMWILWAWLITVPPRMACLFFRLVHLPRVGYGVAALLVGVLLWGATLGRTRLHVSEVEICSQRLPQGFDGLRVVQLSDIHLGTIVCPGRELQRIVDRVNALNPDLVIFTGDLVNVRHTEIDARASRILSGLKAPVYSVTGNHDSGDYIKDTISLPRLETMRQVIARQREMGWRVLDDTTVYLTRQGDLISLSGISYDTGLGARRHDQELPRAHIEATYRGVPDSLYNITAAHLPQLWGQIREAGYGDLTLSGHVHAMQMKIKLFGHAFSPAQLIYPYWSGRYDEGRHTLYVNDGTGYVAYPMRLGAWPELTLFTFKRCE